MSDVTLSDIHRIKGILQSHGLHEAGCAWRGVLDDGKSWPRHPDCNCFLSEDPFDMEKDPPEYIDGFSNIAETSRMHIYSDGRRRSWTRKRGGDWEENGP